MTDTLSKALLIATIGLPVMIGVIGLFALVAKTLVLLFPRDGEAEQRH
ncbi:MAG TPA: hypothetical protein VLK32_05450 [Bacillota bacterium]|nr:hypothetical protein [Bacillota bacterium]